MTDDIRERIKQLDSMYIIGIDSAHFAEKGEVNIARIRLHQGLGEIVSSSYRQQYSADDAAHAEKLLRTLDDPALSAKDLKRVAIEVAYFDLKDDEKKKKILERYSTHSVATLLLTRKYPNLASIEENLDDLVDGIAGAAKAVGRAGAYVGRGIAKLAHSIPSAMIEYLYTPAPEKLAGANAALKMLAKVPYYGALAVYHAAHAVGRGMWYGLFFPTGIRKASTGMDTTHLNNLSDRDALKTMCSGVVGFFSGFYTVAMTALVLTGDHEYSQSWRLIFPIALAASTVYEIARPIVRRIKSRREELMSYTSLASPQAKVRVETAASPAALPAQGIEDAVPPDQEEIFCEIVIEEKPSKNAV